MRRSPLVIAATLAGTAGVLAVHPPASSFSAANPAGTSASASASPTRRTSATSGSASASGAAAGDPVSTRYGPVQVKVTIKNRKITSVDPLALTGADRRSAQISAAAAPTLRQEALSRQSAAIDAVSGATYTSAGYAQSLQSALDKLGYEAPDGSVATLQVPA